MIEMIERFSPRLLQSASREQPVVLATARAFLDCGCSGYVGERTDTRQEVTVLRACSARHDRLIETSRRALIASLQDRKPASTVELVDGLLREAAKVVR